MEKRLFAFQEGGMNRVSAEARFSFPGAGSGVQIYSASELKLKVILWMVV